MGTQKISSEERSLAYLLNDKDPTDFNLSKVDHEALKNLERLVADLCSDFTVYKQVFSSSEVRKLVYKLGEDVMFTLERALLFRLCMKFSALVGDVSKGGVDKRVLSLRELTAPLNSKLLNQKVDKVISFYTDSGLKVWRNKLAAHNDKKFLLSGKGPILDISTDKIYKQLEDVNEIMNILKGKYSVYTDVEVHFESEVKKMFNMLKNATE